MNHCWCAKNIFVWNKSYAQFEGQRNTTKPAEFVGCSMLAGESFPPWPRATADNQLFAQPTTDITSPYDWEKGHCVLPLQYDFYVDYKSTRIALYRASIEAKPGFTI